jgi:enamine deaminase RidA (YjgF/YER057c/UK114 family)
MTIETKLEAMGFTLPAPLTPPGNFQAIKVHGGLAYVSGHGPFDGATVLVQGLVGRDLSADQAYDAARLTALSILASLKHELGDLDRITQWIRVVCYVHCVPWFAQNAAVVNGFSDLIVELWGEAGRHARSAPVQGPSPLNVRSSWTRSWPSNEALRSGESRCVPRAGVISSLTSETRPPGRVEGREGHREPVLPVACGRDRGRRGFHELPSGAGKISAECSARAGARG